MLSVCSFTPIYGRLCNIIGRQASMQLALAIFTTGTVLCAIAPNMWFLIFARVVAGLGGGGISTGKHAIRFGNQEPRVVLS
jgi:MFS family permease